MIRLLDISLLLCFNSSLSFVSCSVLPFAASTAVLRMRSFTDTGAASSNSFAMLPFLLIPSFILAPYPPQRNHELEQTLLIKSNAFSPSSPSTKNSGSDKLFSFCAEVSFSAVYEPPLRRESVAPLKRVPVAPLISVPVAPLKIVPSNVSSRV